ncbi:HAMP domain-containing protein [Nocardioides oleivorans]|uniref:HAMP domain-containing protein n=1 Tax=Nocardioides oleivorans TaxID=273676 RepID=A0A4Q2S179_9ACTN|nr:adenylate/guanylate cyclase domain-containing protein [Nocardioides oleivorans]RYB93763.1 HAMP domain-containing protein [Nocardioides oleivorans]
MTEKLVAEPEAASPGDAPSPPAPVPGVPAAADERPRRRLLPNGIGSIQSKLLLMLLLTSIISTVIVGWFGFRSGTDSLRDATYSRLSEVGDERLKAIQDFVANQRGAVVLDSQGVGVEASRAFNSAFRELDGAQVSDAQQADLESFYSDTYIPHLNNGTGGDFDAAGFVPRGGATGYLQANYTISSTDFDEVAGLDDAGDGSAWSAANARFNPYFRAVGESLGLDDVLMLDGDGNIVYSLYKGAELGTNIVTGDFRSGGLQQVFQDSVRSNSRDFVATADFESYLPSYGAPTMFIASPIGTEGRLTGVLVYELSSEKINGVLSGDAQAGEFQGLGDTGEAYLVGPDETLRTDSRELFTDGEEFRDEAINAGNSADTVDLIMATQRTMLLLQDRSTPAERAGRGQDGTIETTDYLGHDVLAAYQPADIPGLAWSLVTKISADEALAPINDFARNLLIATALVILLVCAASILMARVFTIPLNRLVDGVRAVAGGDLGAQVDSGNRRDEFGDLGAAFNDMSSSLNSKQRLLEAQQAENSRILGGIMPAPLAERYRGGETEISAEHEDVSVVYVEVEGFDAFSRRKSAKESLDLLNGLSRGFDEAARSAGIEKVRQVGTGYVASSGLVVQRVDHARRVVDFALSVADMVERFNSQNGSSLSMRAGINTGSVSSGIVGRSDIVYNLWGDSVELAYRVRTAAGEPGIYVTDEVKQRLGGGYAFQQSGTVTEGDTTVPVWSVRPGSGSPS